MPARLICLALLLAAAPSDGQGLARKPGAHERLPDYDAPDSQFVAADFNALASEFLDEHAGQYVMFEGGYVSHGRGALLEIRGLPYAETNFMSAIISSPTTNGVGAAPRTVSVLWRVEDRGLGRPFLDLQPYARLRIYAYVVPANARAYLKSRQTQFWKGVPIPVVLLIRAVPVTDVK
jgi:hypothetical protein